MRPSVECSTSSRDVERADEPSSVCQLLKCWDKMIICDAVLCKVKRDNMATWTDGFSYLLPWSTSPELDSRCSWSRGDELNTGTSKTEILLGWNEAGCRWLCEELPSLCCGENPRSQYPCFIGEHPHIRADEVGLHWLLVCGGQRWQVYGCAGCNRSFSQDGSCIPMLESVCQTSSPRTLVWLFPHLWLSKKNSLWPRSKFWKLIKELLSLLGVEKSQMLQPLTFCYNCAEHETTSSDVLHVNNDPQDAEPRPVVPAHGDTMLD